MVHVMIYANYISGFNATKKGTSLCVKLIICIYN